VGWIVEKLVLELTALGYASSWIGGVFSRAKAEEAVNAGGEEIVPAVIAFGWPAGRRKVADKVVAASARARSRKPLDDIVFLLSGDGLDDVWLAVAEAVREAPSASNKQPWRLVRLSDESRWLLFLDEDKIYNNGRKDVHLQNLDLGIAMRHFQVAAEASDLAGAWTPVTRLQPDARDAALDEALAFGCGKGWSPCALWS
ncbi:MAG: hypothetical protein LLF89_06000, partial [Spirochaetaceae bacterium]|nr:hypothetical protein [Spirochaetaceae bacterium]